MPPHHQDPVVLVEHHGHCHTLEPDNVVLRVTAIRGSMSTNPRDVVDGSLAMNGPAELVGAT
jgi:hypothetical protein